MNAPRKRTPNEYEERIAALRKQMSDVTRRLNGNNIPLLQDGLRTEFKDIAREFADILVTYDRELAKIASKEIEVKPLRLL